MTLEMSVTPVDKLAQCPGSVKARVVNKMSSKQLKCATCLVQEDSQYACLCDNACGTHYCENGHEWYLDGETVKIGHAPHCDGSDDEDGELGDTKRFWRALEGHRL
jgi:hypothetical protein